MNDKKTDAEKAVTEILAGFDKEVVGDLHYCLHHVFVPAYLQAQEVTTCLRGRPIGTKGLWFASLVFEYVHRAILRDIDSTPKDEQLQYIRAAKKIAMSMLASEDELFTAAKAAHSKRAAPDTYDGVRFSMRPGEA